MTFFSVSGKYTDKKEQRDGTMLVEAYDDEEAREFFIDYVFKNYGAVEVERVKVVRQGKPRMVQFTSNRRG